MARVIQFHRTGGPEVLQFDEVDIGAPGPGELRLRVHAFGLNRAEAMFRSGMYLEQPKLPARLGYEVVLSSSIIEHRIGSQKMGPNLSHRLRWARSTRRSRPLGYWGQVFTYPIPLALLLLAATHAAAWPAAAVAMVLRAGAAAATSMLVVRDPLFWKQLWLLPVQDVLGFAVWIGGFLGDTVVWRDRKCTILRDGRLEVN